MYRRCRSRRVDKALGHTTDLRTQRLVLFSGFEVKKEDGVKVEALAQLVTWLFATLQHISNTAESTLGERSEDARAAIPR